MAGRLQLGSLLRDTETQLSTEELCLTCAIISTADYCVETTEQVSHHHHNNHGYLNIIQTVGIENAREN